MFDSIVHTGWREKRQGLQELMLGESSDFEEFPQPRSAGKQCVDVTQVYNISGGRVTSVPTQRRIGCKQLHNNEVLTTKEQQIVSFPFLS